MEKQILSTRQQPDEKEEVIEETPEGERLNVYLAYLPTDPKAIQQCGYEAYFVNDSNYYLYFNYMNRENNSWTSRYHGQIEPNTKIFLEEFEKKDLNQLERICVQLIAFKKRDAGFRFRYPDGYATQGAERTTQGPANAIYRQEKGSKLFYSGGGFAY